MLSCVERNNGCQLAELLCHSAPHRVQHLLDRAVWDDARVRCDLRTYVLEHFADENAELVMDESGFLKKGDHSCGVKRQYCGTAGRIENCQVGVLVVSASSKGHTLLDAALYLPEEWAKDSKRRQHTKVPASVAFATKPQLAQQMLTAALDAGVPAAFVTADSVYGNDAPLRAWLQNRRQAYVLAIKCDLRLLTEGGHIRAQTLANRLPASAWQTHSCGEGAKGPRLFDWASVPLDAPAREGLETL